MIDIVIVNYKSTDYLHTCLDSVYNSINGTETNVYVFDNGSKDRVDFIRSSFPDTNLIKNERNLGFSKAINRLLVQSNSPYVAILNPDTIVTNGLFESAVSFMENNPDVGILGPKIFDSDGRVQGSARSFPTLSSAFFGRNSVLTKLLPNSRIARANILAYKSDGKTPMDVDWVSGACMAIRRKALEDVGLVDERFFLYWEDVDWCKRMWDKGWRVTYYPKVVIQHSVGGSSEHNLIRSVFEFHRSAYSYYKKHYRSYQTILKPVVLLGLSFRFAGVLSVHAMRRTLMSSKRNPEKIERKTLYGHEN